MKVKAERQRQATNKSTLGELLASFFTQVRRLTLSERMEGEREYLAGFLGSLPVMILEIDGLAAGFVEVDR